jgi:hypothetical protein
MTLTQFVAGLSALTVTGVKRKYTEPPALLNAADLPAMYPRVPENGATAGSFAYSHRMRTLVCEMIIAVQAVKLGSNASNQTLTLALMDNLHDTLVAASGNLGIDTWSMSMQSDQVSADSYHWLIVCRVEGSTT